MVDASSGLGPTVGPSVPPVQDAGNPGATSLALYRQSLALQRCPNRLGWRVRNRLTGEIRPARCGRLGCPFCIRVEAHGVALAIGLAEPERAVRLSLVGETWQERRSRIFRLRYRIREAGYRSEDCYHVEPNPRGTGHHAHLWQWGDYIPQRKLQALAKRESIGIPYIERVRASGPMSYGLKAVTYGLKGVEDHELYLEANGKRLVHASRGFWREGADGPHISRIRGAVRVARERAYGASEGVWILERDAA